MRPADPGLRDAAEGSSEVNADVGVVAKAEGSPNL